jgi:predicted secreted protein
MSTIGYNGKELYVEIDDVLVAAVVSKTSTFTREGVDVTTDDSNGHRILLPRPGLRAIDVSVEGVLTSNNYQPLIEEWEGDTLSDITLVSPNGDRMTASEGFFLNNLEFSAAQDGSVTFTGTLMSSGTITRTPAVS